MHVETAEFHPECNMDCPAYEGHPESSRIWSRNVSESEWSKWAGELARFFPSFTSQIPARFLEEENAKTVERDEQEEEEMQIVQGALERAEQAATSNPPADSASDPSSKRKRASDPAASIPSTKRAKTTELQRSKHWEIDGNVIIRVDDCLFKLQKSRLAKLSTWFREIFEGMGLLKDAKEHDTPIKVNIPGFSVQDFEVMLDAMDSFV